MKMSLGFILIILIAVGCNTNQQSASPTVDLETEREAVQTAIRTFFDAYEAEDWSQARQVLTASDDFQFFGTDTAEVSMDIDDFQQQLSDDWTVLENIEMGALRRLSLMIDENGQLASAIYEVPFTATPADGGERFTFVGRLAHTLRKEDGNWRIAQGMFAMPTSGASSAEQVEEMEGSS